MKRRVKLITLFSLVALTGPALVLPTSASAKDHKASPASREIANAEYSLKNLRRRFSRDRWKKSENTRRSARKAIAQVRKQFEQVKKKDSAWNIRPQLQELQRFEGMVAAAEKANGDSANVASSSKSLADTMKIENHSAASDIRMARYTMKSLRKKIAKKKYVNDSRLRRDMAFDFKKLEKTTFPRIAKQDRKFPLGAWQKEVAEFKRRVKAASDKEAQGQQAAMNAVRLRGEYHRIVDSNRYLDLLYKAKKGKFSTGHYEWMQQKLDGLDKFAIAFASACKKKGYETIPQSKFRKERRYPKVTCGLARDHRALALAFVKANAKAEVKKLVKKQQEAIKVLKRDGAITPGNYSQLAHPEKTVTLHQKKYEKVYKKFGGRAHRQLFLPLGAQKADFDAALKVAAKRNRFPKDARFSEATLGASVKRKVSGAKLLRARAIQKAWKIKTTPLKIPVSQEQVGFHHDPVEERKFLPR